MSRFRAEYLINQLINNQLTEAELDELLRAIGEEDLKENYSDLLEKYYEQLLQADVPADSKHAISEKIESLKKDRIRQVTKRWFVKPVRKYRLVAAAGLVLTGFGALLYLLIYPTSLTGQTETGAQVGKEHSEQIRADRGEQKSVQLSDGSQVKLNADSRLSYPGSFSLSERQVALVGEGFFAVERDEDRPFMVTTPSLKIQVAGTSFNVKAYEEEEEITVTVQSGKVLVRLDPTPDSLIHLSKNQQLLFHKTSGQYILRTVESAMETAWTEGLLQFRNTPLHEVVKTLERRYDVKVQVLDQRLSTATLTGSHKNESLTSVLEAIAFAVGAKYHIEGKTVTLTQDSTPSFSP